MGAIAGIADGKKYRARIRALDSFDDKKSREARRRAAPRRVEQPAFLSSRFSRSLTLVTKYAAIFNPPPFRSLTFRKRETRFPRELHFAVFSSSQEEKKMRAEFSEREGKREASSRAARPQRV